MSTLTFTNEATTVDPALVERRKRDRERRSPTFNPLVPQVFDWGSYRWVSELPAIYAMYAVTVDRKGREHAILVAFVNLKSPGARLTVRRMNMFYRKFARKLSTKGAVRAASFIRYVELFSAQARIHESSNLSGV